MSNITLEEVLSGLRHTDGHETEFLQAVTEVAGSLKPVFDKDPSLVAVFQRLVVPERIIQFRVVWSLDSGQQQVNRGYRIEFNSAIGPYKGGLRFHPTVNQSVLKFLGFEQVFKNALTTLPLGGGKGGSDFDPKGKSDAEVMRFCQAFMTELSRHIGPNTDVPAGDIGVGGREIGYMFGQYKRLRNEFTGVLTGKGIEWGGSLIRPEATGYGAVYFAAHIMEDNKLEFKGKKCLISGSGNVAQYCAEKLIELGAIPMSMSDSAGYIYDSEGISTEKLAFIMDIKNVKRGRISEYAKQFPSAKYVAGKRPWGEAGDIAFPCATQNEIEESDANSLAANGCLAVVEGANMPSTNEAIDVFKAKKIHFGPAKAANAGGVAVSGLEMTQNSMRLAWTREEVDSKLKSIMASIFKQSVDTAAHYDPGNYQLGANAAGFLKVANAMKAQGLV